MKKLLLTILTLAIMISCEEATSVDTTPIKTWDEIFLGNSSFGEANHSYITMLDDSDTPFIEYDKAKNIVGAKRGVVSDIFTYNRATLTALPEYYDFITIENGADLPAEIKTEDYITYFDNSSNFDYDIQIGKLVGTDNPYGLEIGNEVAKIYIWADAKHTDLATVYSFRL